MTEPATPVGRGHPAITALVACALLLLTVLGALRHESSVAHVRDAVSGQLRHAHALAFHHTTIEQDLLGRLGLNLGKLSENVSKI